VARPYYYAVAFDFDGTLVDTMHRYADIAAEAMASHFEIPAERAHQLYLETSGVPFFQQLELIFGSDPRTDGCVEQFERVKAAYLETVTLDDAARAALARMRGMGLSLAIASNNFQTLLDRFLVDDPELFDIVLGYGPGISKGPVMFSRVRDRFGVDRRHLLFVGDSLADAQKAYAFGLDFIAISGTVARDRFEAFYPGLCVVDTLDEVADRLASGRPVAQL
jgi:phosphoglycolate phosphatase-like HAD superfamily hydrolase